MKKFIAALLCAVLVLSLAASALAAGTVLRPGDKGSAVRKVQKALNEQGFASLTVDGVYGPKTKAAIVRFQRAKGLTVDGKAGPNTLNLLLGETDLDNDPNLAAPENSDTLHKGSTGPAVRALQTLLRSYGYLTSTVDGVYGKKTEAAVRSFQKLNNLAVSGIAYANTVALLNSGSAVAYYEVKEYPTLRPGDAGSNVTKLQKKLIDLGYPISVTGYYNEETEAAVRDYQSTHSLTIDGIAGQKTHEAMFGH